ncbi:10382_t:CDS:2, partial [Funneliformis geosporum]
KLIIPDNQNLTNIEGLSFKSIKNLNLTNSPYVSFAEIGEQRKLILTENIQTPKQAEEAIRRLLKEISQEWREYFESEDLDIAEQKPLLGSSFKYEDKKRKGKEILEGEYNTAYDFDSSLFDLMEYLKIKDKKEALEQLEGEEELEETEVTKQTLFAEILSTYLPENRIQQKLGDVQQAELESRQVDYDQKTENLNNWTNTFTGQTFNEIAHEVRKSTDDTQEQLVSTETELKDKREEVDKLTGELEKTNKLLNGWTNTFLEKEPQGLKIELEELKEKEIKLEEWNKN